MERNIQLLDCTLRDGAYIVDGRFGAPAMKGIIQRMGDANVDIIECGWLKDKSHQEGTTFYRQPSDLKPYIGRKNRRCAYAVMMDWDRYDLNGLEECDGSSADAVRIVFPREHFKEGIALGELVKQKGYEVYFQAANTLAYSEKELWELAQAVNAAQPKCLSVVDTFGAMDGEDLSRIVEVLGRHVDKSIRLGFHSHNNQQLSFALSMQFVQMLAKSGRGIVVDASLCGMGRGAGNTATELAAGFLNRKWRGSYDLDVMMDAIDLYMGYFMEHYEWGYSVPYLIAGMYGAHVNNIAYLRENHRTNAKEMRNIIESLPPADRRRYDYGLLEEKYLEYQNKAVQDEGSMEYLRHRVCGRKMLVLCPGRSLLEQKERILDYIKRHCPVVIGVNAVQEPYPYDALFFSSTVRYTYAKEAYPDLFCRYPKILSSNIKTEGAQDERVIHYHRLVKRGWEHFDNAGMMCLRLLDKLGAAHVALAGFDGFADGHEKSYADPSLPRIDPGKKWEALNEEIKEMFADFQQSVAGVMELEFLTESKYMGKE